MMRYRSEGRRTEEGREVEREMDKEEKNRRTRGNSERKEAVEIRFLGVVRRQNQASCGKDKEGRKEGEEGSMEKRRRKGRSSGMMEKCIF